MGRRVVDELPRGMREVPIKNSFAPKKRSNKLRPEREGVNMWSEWWKETGVYPSTFPIKPHPSLPASFSPYVLCAL